MSRTILKSNQTPSESRKTWFKKVSTKIIFTATTPLPASWNTILNFIQHISSTPPSSQFLIAGAAQSIIHQKKSFIRLQSVEVIISLCLIKFKSLVLREFITYSVDSPPKVDVKFRNSWKHLPSIKMKSDKSTHSIFFIPWIKHYDEAFVSIAMIRHLPLKSITPVDDLSPPGWRKKISNKSHYIMPKLSRLSLRNQLYMRWFISEWARSYFRSLVFTHWRVKKF